jgi:UPF0271 protein
LKKRIDINCDLGESYGHFKIGNDEKIMPYITSANIACGFHAGDPLTMAKTVELAKKFDVAVGAHPGYPDILGFGRRNMELSHDEAKNYIIYQIGALEAFAKSVGLKLQHVKLHGALYNAAAENAKLSIAVVEAVKQLNSELIIFAPPKSKTCEVAEKKGLKVALEAFADRAYTSNGRLAPRTIPEAVIEKLEVVAKRAIKIVTEGTVESINGDIIELGEIHTICVHGDNFQAVKLAEYLNKSLRKAGIEIRPVKDFL